MRLRTPAWEYKHADDLTEEEYVDMQLSPYRLRAEMDRLGAWVKHGVCSCLNIERERYGTLTRSEYAYCIAAAYMNITSGEWKYEDAGKNNPARKKKSVFCRNVISRAYKSLCYDSYGKYYDIVS